MAANKLLRQAWAFCISLAIGSAALAQLPTDDDMLTLVVGTRFVMPTTSHESAKAMFDNARIPLSAFNETDHCIDKVALEVAQEYFTALGRVMGKAGHYYFVPDDRIKKAARDCESMQGKRADAWVDVKTKIVAFGRVVPTATAPSLEEQIK